MDGGVSGGFCGYRVVVGSNPVRESWSGDGGEEDKNETNKES